MNEHRKAKPTQADIRAAKKLREVWTQRARERGLTQDVMAERMDISQGAVSQYLNGKIPMNFRVLAEFCEALGIETTDIRTDLPEQRYTIRKVSEASPTPYVGMERGQVPYLKLDQIDLWLAGKKPPVEGWMFCPVDVGRRAFVTLARGVAMAPRFNDGEFIYVDPDEPQLHGESLLLLDDAGEPLLRELSIDGEVRMLSAINPDWPGPRMTPLLDNARIAGTIVGKWVPA